MDSRGKLPWQQYFSSLTTSQREAVKKTTFGLVNVQRYLFSLDPPQREGVKSAAARPSNVKKHLAAPKPVTVEGFVRALYSDYLAARTEVSMYGQGEKRVEAAQYKIQSILQADPSFRMSPSTKYLDVGSGDGVLAIELASKYGVQDYLLSDVQNYLATSVRAKVGDRFVILQPGRALRAGNDVVSSFQVLHHAGDLLEELPSLASALRGGGKLLLSEHDVSSGAWHNLVLLEHISFEISEIDREESFEDFEAWFDSYDLSFTSFSYLNEELVRLGFRLIGKTNPTSKNATYYAIYVKETEEIFLHASNEAVALQLWEAVDFTYRDGQPLITAVRLYPSLAKRYIQSDRFPAYMHSGNRVRALVRELYSLSGHPATMQIALDITADVIVNDTREKEHSAAYLWSLRQAVKDGNVSFARVVYDHVNYPADLLEEVFAGVDVTFLTSGTA